MEPPKRIPPAAWIAGGVLLVAIVGVLGASYASMRRRSEIEMCGVNLRTLYTAIRSGEHPDSPKWNEMGTGRAFLANYPNWPTHQPRPLDLNCPVKGPSLEIDYRGPARPLPQMGKDEPILSDRPGNHGPDHGGNVVLKTGAVYSCEKKDPLWAAAERSTRD
jgi:hypothetical protein